MAATQSNKKIAGRRAAQQVSQQTDLRIELPGLGVINLGPPEQLVYLGGIGALIALDIIEWPIAIVLAAGHLLSHQHRNKALNAFGEALEEA